MGKDGHGFQALRLQLSLSADNTIVRHESYTLATKWLPHISVRQQSIVAAVSSYSTQSTSACLSSSCAPLSSALAFSTSNLDLPVRLITRRQQSTASLA